MRVREYFSPASLDEATELLTTSAGPARTLAGGTDLLVQMLEEPSPEIRVVSLRHIKALREICQNVIVHPHPNPPPSRRREYVNVINKYPPSPGGGGLGGGGAELLHQNQEDEIFVGAMVTHTEVAQSPLLKRYFPALAKASGMVGSPSIRNMATIGGNICNASPSADTAPPLLAYNAKAIIWGPTGEKRVSIEDFFIGPSMSIVKAGEILKGFLLRPEKRLIAAYSKLGMRKAMEIAIVNVCVSMIVEKNNYCSEIRIALGAVAPTPIRAKRAEDTLRDKKITPKLIKETAKVAVSETKPISDIRASADYRKEMIGVLVEKTISELWGRHQNKI